MRYRSLHARGGSVACHGRDDDGNYRAIVYAQKAAIVMELFYYCPEPFDPHDAITWTTAQLQLLPS